MKNITYIYSDWATYKTNQYGQVLSDIVELLVDENRNGSFELMMQYPVDGANASLIVTDAIVKSVPSQGADPAPFRIYRITRDIVGMLTVYARHIVYDVDGCIIEPFSISYLSELPAALNTHYGGLFSEFRVFISGYTDPSHISFPFTTNVPKSLWQILGDVCEALRSIGCELSYRYLALNSTVSIILNQSRGVSNGAIIAYGYNLLSMQGTLDNSGVYTAIYPYYYRWIMPNPYEYVELPEKVISTGAVGRTRILPVSFSSEFDDPPTVAQLRSVANSFVAASDWSEQNDITLDFVPLQNTTEYEGVPNQTISLCDRVTVSASFIGISLQSKVVRAVYNPLIDKYTQITVGTRPSDLADTIVTMERQLGGLENQSRIAAYGGGVS